MTIKNLDLTKNLTPKRMQALGVAADAGGCFMLIDDEGLCVDICEALGVLHMFNRMRTIWAARGFIVNLEV